MLIAATVAAPAAAQLAKKNVGQKSDMRKAAAMTVNDVKKAPGKADSRLYVLPSKTASNGIKVAKSGKVSNGFSAPVVKAAPSDMPVINGNIIFNDQMNSGAMEPGLYNLPKSATEDGTFLFGTDGGNYGCVLVNGVYYVHNYVNYGFFAFITITGYDVETGEEVFDCMPENVDVLAPGGLVYDASDATVYGITYNTAGNALQLSKLVYGDNTVTVTAVGALDGNWNSLAIDAAGQLYGISYSGHYEGSGDSETFVIDSSALNKIDKATAAVTSIGDTGMVPQYLSSSAIDTKTGKMYWNVCTPDENGYMCEVNLSTGAATVLYQLKNNDEIMGMYVPAPAAEETAPAECENVAFHFDGASLSGTVTLKTPSTLFDGTAGSGELMIMVFANGEQVGILEPAQWGADVTIPVDLSLMGAGMYDFIVFAAGDGGEGPKTKVRNVWVGADTPEATKATLQYVNGNMELSWNAVTASVNGGYIDLDNITYKVVRYAGDAEGVVVAEGLTTTSFTEAISEPATLTAYYYEVYVVDGDLVSAPAVSNVVNLGSITPPYDANFSENGLDGWTIIDANGDGKTWAINGGVPRIAYNSNLAMDDWMITPAINVEAGKMYLISFDAYAQSTSYVEKFEVKYGSSATVAGLDKTLVGPTEVAVKSDDPMHFEQYIVPDAAGKLYIGFHGISEADKFYLFINNFQISAGVSAGAPAECTDLSAVADASGALKATVSFKAPTKDMAGNALSTLTDIKVYNSKNMQTPVGTISNPTPGNSYSVTDENVAERGEQTYYVVASNADGAGPQAEVNVYVGFSAPADITEVNIARTATVGEVALNWNAVTTDVNGLTYPAGSVTYNVYDVSGSERVKVAENLSTTSYSYQAVEAGEQAFVQYMVFAVYDNDEGAGQYSAFIPVGTPYAGIDESLAEGKLHYIWGLSPINGGTVTLGGDDSFSDLSTYDNDGGMFIIQGEYLDTGARLFSGLVSLDQMVNPGLTFALYNIGGDDIDEIEVAVCEDGGEYQVLKSGTIAELTDNTEGWNKISVALTQFANKTIQFQITGITKQYKYKMIDAIKVGSMLGKDLKAAGITAPASVKAGADYTVDVKVQNEGAQAAASYKVELYADEELVETKDCTDLASGASTTVSFNRTMSAIATEAVTYFAKVVFDGDENETNNQTSDVVVTPKVSTLPVATNLAAANEAGAVKLTWDEPNLEGGVAEPVTYDFEDGNSFANTYGDFIFVDVDQSAVGGFQNMDIPGIEPGQNTGSFWVWDHTLLGNDTFKAHSGEKYLFALFRYDDGTTDDWAITPELDGSAQDVTFYARSYSASYPEEIEMYYSTGSTEVADFVKIDGVGGEVPADWTLYTVSVPAGAKRMAIRSCATGSFMLMVDDVTLIPAEGSTANLVLKGYNVYRDGVKINTEVVEDTEYVDSNVVDGETYTYVVTAVYEEKGESAASNEAVILVQNSGVDAIGNGSLAIYGADGSVVILNAEGLDVTVASANGAVIFSGAGDTKTVVTAGSGVYVVKAGKTVKKVIVK